MNDTASRALRAGAARSEPVRALAAVCHPRHPALPSAGLLSSLQTWNTSSVEVGSSLSHQELPVTCLSEVGVGTRTVYSMECGPSGLASCHPVARQAQGCHIPWLSRGPRNLDIYVKLPDV